MVVVDWPTQSPNIYTPTVKSPQATPIPPPTWSTRAWPPGGRSPTTPWRRRRDGRSSPRPRPSTTCAASSSTGGWIRRSGWRGRAAQLPWVIPCREWRRSLVRSWALMEGMQQVRGVRICCRRGTGGRGLIGRLLLLGH